MTVTLVRHPITDARNRWDAGRTAGSTRNLVLHRTGDPSYPGLEETSFGVPLIDIVDEWGQQSFPASDPPANW